MSNTMNNIAIRPGIMLSLSVQSKGGVRYSKRILDDTIEDGTEVSTWETVRTIIDKAEYKRATKVRTDIRHAITKVCLSTPFGELCPKDNEAKLDEAIAKGRALASEWNAQSRYTRVYLYVLKGQIAETDEEAAREVAAQVRSLLDDIAISVKEADVEAIRKTAIKAKAIGQMLEGEPAEQVSEAIKAARTAAREIVKRVQKKGEDVEEVLAKINLAPINVARFALGEPDTELDLGEEDALPPVDSRRMGGLFDDPEPLAGKGA